MLCFGEAVEFRVRTKHKLDRRWWQEAVFLGVRIQTTEKIVGTPSEIFIVLSIRRVLQDRRYKYDLLSSVIGLA